MVVKQTERIMARRQIRAVIDADPILITFLRRPRIPTSDGAYKLGEPIAILPGNKPQKVTLIPFKRRMSEFLVNTELGNVPDLPYVLLGLHTLDIAEKDIFFWAGNKFEVQTLDLKEEVRIAAHVDYFGGAPSA